MEYEKRKRKTGSKPAEPADVLPLFTGKHQFINPYLSDADKAHLADNADSLIECVMELAGCVRDEYSLRVAFDRHSLRYNALLTCVADGIPNTGLILSVRGAAPTDALYALHYLHFVKSEGLWRSIAPQSGAASRFG